MVPNVVVVDHSTSFQQYIINSCGIGKASLLQDLIYLTNYCKILNELYDKEEATHVGANTYSKIFQKADMNFKIIYHITSSTHGPMHSPKGPSTCITL